MKFEIFHYVYLHRVYLFNVPKVLLSKGFPKCSCFKLTTILVLLLYFWSLSFLIIDKTFYKRNNKTYAHKLSVKYNQVVIWKIY